MQDYIKYAKQTTWLQMKGFTPKSSSKSFTLHTFLFNGQKAVQQNKQKYERHKMSSLISLHHVPNITHHGGKW